MHRLVLFDIDGTLLSDGGAAREAYAYALEAVYGYHTELRRYDFSGRTDPQITHMVLGDAGLSAEAIDAAMPRLWEHYLAALERSAPGRVRVLAGVRPLLETLAGDGRVMLGLLTGNIEPGARVKLGNAALNDFFPFGAFGSDSARREELPPIAVERASQFAGRHFSGRDVVIIGDSIYDVRCGVPHSATTIAIASGKTAEEKLRAENPDYLFASSEQLDEIVAAIMS
jgi:phosphoglycolate phosphatase-like HAD superfamily hydrolase